MFKLACILRVMAFAPLVWVGVFYSFVVRAWLSLGQLPYPYKPDPKDLGFDTHMDAVLFGFLATVAAIAIYFALWVIDGKRSGKYDRSSLRIQLVGCTVLAVIVFGDPGKFLEWFMD